MTEQDLARLESAQERVGSWCAHNDWCHPFWEDYRPLILRLQAISGQGSGLPAPYQLQRLLPDAAVNHAGQAITFAPGEALPGIEYEQHVYLTGEVSTRKDSWHDLFNALVWARFPRLKAAINAAHYQEILAQKDKHRSRLRDALTLLDECGAIVTSANPEMLAQLADRDWRTVFGNRLACWRDEIRILVCGHALLEKFLKPYKSLTAHAVLVCLDAPFVHGPRESLIQILDVRLAEILCKGSQFRSPAQLSPLPLMGIPGWWPLGPQDQAFYADRQVFRRPAQGLNAAPIFDLKGPYQEIP